MRYFQTYFNIECGYCTGETDRTDECLSELERTFRDSGWEITVPRSPGRCPEVRLGKTALYCHPTQLGGPVEESLIPTIEKMLKSGSSYRFLSTNVYHELLDIRNEEIPEFLERQYGDLLDRRLPAILKTKKRNLYYNKPGILDKLSREYDPQTLDRPYVGVPSNAAVQFVERHIGKLLQDGTLMSTTDRNGVTCLRTATPKDGRIFLTSPQPAQ